MEVKYFNSPSIIPITRGECFFSFYRLKANNACLKYTKDITERNNVLIMNHVLNRRYLFNTGYYNSYICSA